MSDDLAEIKGRLGWVRGEINTLDAEIRAKVPHCFRCTRAKNLFDPDMLWLCVEPISPLPAGVPARTGTIINEIRSCLDALASTLAIRNGKTANQVYFPIVEAEKDFYEKDCQNKILKLTDDDKAKIAAIQPYAFKRDGSPANPLLWGLHKADVRRKHQSLVAHSTNSSVAIGNGYIGFMQGFVERLDKFTRVAMISKDQL